MGDEEALNARRDRLRPLKVWVSAQERTELTGRAQSACLSLSAYLRAAGLSHPIKRLYDLKAVDEFARVGNELSLLGTALNRTMTPGAGHGGSQALLKKLLQETRELQDRLLELMSRV